MTLPVSKPRPIVSACCSVDCPRYTSCAVAICPGYAVNYMRSGSGGTDIEDMYDCGPIGNYAKYIPAKGVVPDA